MKSIDPQVLRRVDERLRADLAAARPRPSRELHTRILGAVSAARAQSRTRRWLRPAAAAASVLALLALGFSLDRREAETAQVPAIPAWTTDWTALFELPALELKLRLDDPLMTELRLLAQDTSRATQNLVQSLPLPLRPRGE